MGVKSGLRGSQTFILALARQGLMSMVDYLEAFLRSGAKEQLDQETLKYIYDYLGRSRHFDELLFSYTNPGEHVEGDMDIVVMDQMDDVTKDLIGLAWMQKLNKDNIAAISDMLSIQLDLSADQVHKVFEAANALVSQAEAETAEKEDE